MEHNPRNQAEEDEARAAKAESLEDDEDEEKEQDEKPAPRRALGVSVEKIESKTEKKEKPRMSITDRLLESIGVKPEEDDTKTKKIQEQPEVATSEEKLEATVTVETLAAPAIEVVVTEDGHTVEVGLFPPAESNPDNEPAAKDASEVMQPVVLEAADWESELSADAEIEQTASHSSGEVAPESPDEPVVFAEIPPSPEVVDEEFDTPVESELLEDGLGSEGPPEPPEDETPVALRSGGGSGSHGSYSGGGGSGGGTERPWYDAAAADRARQEELNHAEYRGQKIGLRHGLAAGLTFGWLFGRHGKKKQAKEHAKEVQKKDKEIGSLKAEQAAATQRLEAVKRTQEQMISSIQQRGSKPSVASENAPQRPVEVKINEQSVARTFESQPAAISVETVKALVDSTVETIHVVEKPVKYPETVAVAAARALERKPHTTIEQAEKLTILAEEQAVDEDKYQVQEGRRVETSAWHRIEIDEKTGKPVKNPGIAYGEEFRREQRQEVLGDDVGRVDDNEQKDSKKAVYKTKAEKNPAAQIGGLAAASYVQDDQAYDATKATETGLAGLPLGQPPEHHLKDSGILRYASMPIVWIAAALIVVFLFVLGVLR